MSLPDPVHERGLVWFRRDLRVSDHAALYHALRSCRRVWCLFVFDTEILEPLLARGLKHDRRVEFIRASVVELSDALRDASAHTSGGLLVRHGRARDVVPQIADALQVDAVFVSHDDEPDAIERDADVAAKLACDGRHFRDFKDQAIFERDELLTQAGTPFTVFTPYKRAWLKAVTPCYVSAYPVDRYAKRLAPLANAGVVLGRDPEPIVDHDAARRATLERYAVVRAA